MHSTLRLALFQRFVRQLGQAAQGVRVAIAVLSLSAAGFVGILTREGYSEKAYPDPVHGTAVPTIGFGSTENVKMGDRTTPVAAAQRTLREVRSFEGGIKRCADGVELLPAEYDLYIELAHNIGPGLFCRSTLLKKLKAREYRAACEQILAFDRAGDQICSEPGNKVCPGLWKDRLRLHKACVEAQP
jgi:lysozyme